MSGVGDMGKIGDGVSLDLFSLFDHMARGKGTMAV